MEEFNLKNWQIMGTKWVAVEVYEMPISNGEKTVYNPTLVISLNDFTSDEDVPIEQQKVLSVCTDRVFSDDKIAAAFLFNQIRDLFSSISSTVFVYNGKHEKINEFSIDEFMDYQNA